MLFLGQTQQKHDTNRFPTKLNPRPPQILFGSGRTGSLIVVKVLKDVTATRKLSPSSMKTGSWLPSQVQLFSAPSPGGQHTPPNGWQILGGHSDHLPAIGGSWSIRFVAQFETGFSPHEPPPVLPNEKHSTASGGSGCFSQATNQAVSDLANDRRRPPNRGPRVGEVPRNVQSLRHPIGFSKRCFLGTCLFLKQSYRVFHECAFWARFQ